MTHPRYTYSRPLLNDSSTAFAVRQVERTSDAVFEAAMLLAGMDPDESYYDAAAADLAVKELRCRKAQAALAHLICEGWLEPGLITWAEALDAAQEAQITPAIMAYVAGYRLSGHGALLSA